MGVIDPTPPDLDLRVVNYESEDGTPFDAFKIEKDDVGRSSRVGMLFLHGLRGYALKGGVLTMMAYPLARDGVQCLSINKRNSGKRYETSDFEEIDRDIYGGINRLEDDGCDEVIICGRSLGATEAAYYGGKRNDDRVSGIVLAAPYADLRRTSENYFETLSDNAKAAYDSFVAAARELVEDGRGNEIVSIPRPVEGDIEYIPMSARSFLSYRAPESSCGTIEWTPDITVPLLILSHEPHRNLQPGEGREIADSATQSPSVELQIIESDHLFTDAEDDVVSHLRGFIDDVSRSPD